MSVLFNSQTASRTKRAFLLAMVGMLLLMPYRGEATVFNVASGDVAGLIAAINAANVNEDTDVINLAAGSYDLPFVGAPWPPGVACGMISVLPPILTPITIKGAGADKTTIRKPEEQYSSSGFSIFTVASESRGVPPLPVTTSRSITPKLAV